MSAGKRIESLRLARGWKGPQLAKAMGIAAASLWEIENGETKSLKAATLMAAADALKANPRYILSGKGSPVAPIDPNTEEAEVVDKLRRMTPSTQAAWLEIGDTLLRKQPPQPASAEDPFPAVKPRSTKRGS